MKNEKKTPSNRLVDLRRYFFSVKYFLYSLIVKTRRKFADRNLQINKEFRVKVSKNRNFKMVYYGGAIERETFRNGLFRSWENDMGWIWLQLCQISNVVFDIGANTGIYSLVAKSVQPNGKVYAFEPSIHSYQKLELNNEINNYNIICEQLAVSNKSHEQIFYDIPDSNQTTASLSPDKMKNSLGYTGGILEYKVITTTFSDYIEKNSISEIDLIKIDVELHEAEVVQGLAAYLNKFKPIICIEILNQTVASKLNEQINLEEFNLFHLRNGNQAVQLADFNICESPAAKAEWNYLIFHKDLEDKIKRYTSLYSK